MYIPLFNPTDFFHFDAAQLFLQLSEAIVCVRPPRPLTRPSTDQRTEPSQPFNLVPFQRQHFITVQCTLRSRISPPRPDTTSCFVSAQEPAFPQSSLDLNVPTSKEEQEEYLRWKREREEIDRERVARHKNSKGQWRRAWDLDKTEHMYDFFEFLPCEAHLMAFDKVISQSFALNCLPLKSLLPKKVWSF